MAAKVYKPEYPGRYYFDTFTFTTLGASGHRGPDSTKGYANAPWNPDQFSIVDGQQQWTVPATGTYNIVAAGAYGATPGRVVSGDIDLYEGQVLSLLVGQQPTPLVANVADNVTVGGGGGTFVVSDGKPLIVASGGDGGVYSTGYLRSELLTENFQYRVSMSADGNVYAAIDLNFITFQFTLKIYRYLSGVWTPEFTAPSVFFVCVVISGDGKTVATPTSNSIAVYEYIDDIWENPRYITNIDWDYVSITVQISYDGNTIVAFTRDIASHWHLYVCTKNQDLTWNTEELSAPGTVDIFTTNQSGSCAISGDGTRIFAAADDIYSYPAVSNLWSYSRTNDTWGLPELYTSFDIAGVVRVESTSVSYDGQTVAIYVGNLQANPLEGYLYVYENGIRTRNLTFPWIVQQYPAGAVQISYDGSLALVVLITGKILVTPSTQITIFDDASGFPLPSGSIDSTASRIVSPYYDVTNPITYFFEVGGSGQPGSFLPSGTGSGISGAGYLTDGQQTNPFFGFLKPKAYVNGGFGNSYEYGQPGVPKEGGFGGGQSPLNKQTDLTSVSGYNQFRPTIPLVSSGLYGMAISEDANTFLASFLVGNSGTAYTNVYTYNGTSWVSTNLYTTSFSGTSLAMSGDGIVWLINADVWRNGTFETTLQSFAFGDVLFKYNSVSRDGNTAVIMYGQMGGVGYFDKTVSLTVHSYSGYWTSSILFSQDPDPEFAFYTCAMSADGNTIAMSYTVTAYGFVNVYRRVEGTWSGPDQILYETHSSKNSIILHVNSDGSVITLSVGSSGNYQYTNGVLSKVDYDTSSGAFSRTDPNLYAWVNSSAVHVPSISLEVTVQVDPAGIDVMRMGSNVLAMSKNLTPHAIVFLDMYSPTTTCTAATSVDHGYPYDYEVQITGTQYFNGTWLITAGSPNTFTFQAFGGPTVTSGYVSGTTTGISGGGGYTGSAGNGVSSATCYADESVANFTDLGAASNSAGYVNVTLVDPPPINQTYDLKTTTSVSDAQVYGSFYWKHILYSPELEVFVLNGSYRYGFDNIATILYSIDGKIWYTGLLQSQTAYGYCKWVTWAPELGVFLACGDIFPWFSSDGINWTQDLNGESTVYFRTVTWIPFLRKFIAVNESDNMLSSSDGKSWSVIQNSPPIPPYGLQISMMSSSDVVVTCIYLDVYSSINGTDWDLTLTTSSPVTSWAYGNGHFFVTTADNYYYYYSTDGYTWQNGTFPIPPSIYWYYINGTTVFLANSVMVTFPENSYISTDYVNWTLYPNNLAAPPGTAMFAGTEYVDSVYNSKKGYVVALAERDIHLTIDGAVWIKADRTFIPANVNASLSYTGYAYSDTSDVIVLTCNQAYDDTTPKGIYYKNGAWKQITGLDFYPQICVWNPINGLFELSDTVSFDPMREMIVSGGSSSDWLIPSLFQTFYEQGLNNNLPRNSAFSISGVIFRDSIDDNPYYFLPMSCDGTTFIVQQNGQIIRSTDGVTWTQHDIVVTNVGEYIALSVYIIKYVSKYKLFVAFGILLGPLFVDFQTSGIFTSKDGIEWTRIYSDEFRTVVQINEVLWNENDDTFIIFYLGRNPTYFKLIPQVL
jgi:hypothetical protein